MGSIIGVGVHGSISPAKTTGVTERNVMAAMLIKYLFNIVYLLLSIAS
jgi:hypothetical protein